MRSYFKVLIGAFLIIAGCINLRNHFSDKKSQELHQKIQNIESLIKSPSEAIAVLDSTYEVTTIKIMDIPTKFYKIKYFFEVNGRQYSGVTEKFQPEKITVLPLIKIKYLAEDPYINSNDPVAELRKLKDEKSSNMDLYFGLGLLLIGIFMVYTNVKTIRIKKREEDEAIEESIREYNKSKGLLQ
jgi:hypothetical protein